MRLSLPLAMAGRAEDLAQREAQCCAFLTIATQRDQAAIHVTITSRDQAAGQVIELLAGTP